MAWRRDTGLSTVFSFGVPNLSSSREEGVRQKGVLWKSQRQPAHRHLHPAALHAPSALSHRGVTTEEDISSQDETTVSHGRKKSTLWIKQHTKEPAVHKIEVQVRQEFGY